MGLLEGRVALITGGAQGIGLAIAQRFSDEGAQVVIADMREDAAVEAAGTLSGEATGVRANVTDPEDVTGMFEHAIEAFGRVDVLVNNAGITRDASLKNMTLEEVEQVIDVHLKGTWIVGMTKSVAREAARANIRVNAIQPGLIATEMTAAMPKEAYEAAEKAIPLGRAGQPDEIAKVALFLASDLSSYCTGITIEVAGGRHM